MARPALSAPAEARGVRATVSSSTPSVTLGSTPDSTTPPSSENDAAFDVVVFGFELVVVVVVVVVFGGVQFLIRLVAAAACAVNSEVSGTYPTAHKIF